MAYTPVATDNFNRADGALGANWTVAYNGGFLVLGNQARSNGSSNDCCSLYTGASFANAQYVKATVAQAPTAHYYALGVATRGNQSGVWRNYCYIGLRDNNERYLSRISNGTPTTLQYYNGGGIAVNDIMQLDSDGSLHSPFRNGTADTSLGTATDSNYASGVPGLSGYNGSTTATMDDWEGGDITAGGGGTVPLMMLMGIGS
jgi:hypothetical protein